MGDAVWMGDFFEKHVLGREHKWKMWPDLGKSTFWHKLTFCVISGNTWSTDSWSKTIFVDIRWQLSFVHLLALVRRLCVVPLRREKRLFQGTGALIATLHGAIITVTMAASKAVKWRTLCLLPLTFCLARGTHLYSAIPWGTSLQSF